MCACLKTSGEGTCSIHVGEKLVYECQDCPNTLVCIECVPTTLHSGHHFIMIRDAVKPMKEKIENYISEEKKSIDEFKQMLTFVNKNISQVEEVFRSLKSTIDDRASAFKKQVEEDSEKILSELKLVNDKNNETLKRGKDSTEMAISETTEMIDKCQTILQENDHVCVYDMAAQIQELTLEPPVDLAKERLDWCDITWPPDTENKVKSLFGNIVQKTESLSFEIQNGLVTEVRTTTSDPNK